jgi:2',3'-cyclic-nucleotide 2'-phosphodiesterase (5'-nucleotidase family)
MTMPEINIKQYDFYIGKKLGTLPDIMTQLYEMYAISKQLELDETLTMALEDARKSVETAIKAAGCVRKDIEDQR